MRQDNPKPAIQRDGNQFRIRNYTSAGRRYRCQRLMRVCPVKSFAKRVQTGTPRAAKAPPRIEKNTVVKKALRDALDERGYDTLTPVQEAVTDPDLLGKDMLVSAQTGSGKTLGFGLVIAPTMLGEAETFDRAGAPLALVIAPTRELALQVKRELAWLFAKAGAYVTSCVGGMDMRDERRALSRGAHIVVATPGRLRDHIMRGSMDTSQLRAVVLDEADEMLDLGFREDLEFILGETPESRQTLMFSATVPKMIATLAKSYQKDAVRVVTKSETSQHADIEYKAMVVSERDSENAVINALRFYEAPNAIVFANTRAMVNRLTTRLSNRGFSVVALSGELSQSERTHALQAMRDGRANVCVATDVAARGIDLPNLDLVIHAELPGSHETLLHRSGRTGRAGRQGVSALVVTKKTRKKAERILGQAKVRAEWENAPSAEAITERDEDRMLTDEAWLAEISEAEQGGVDKLTAQFSPQQIAAAYLRLYRSMRSAPEELSDVDAKPAPRQEFGASVWFAVPGGRAAEAEPRRLLPMLCKAGDLTKDDIGAIRIQPEFSYVQIRESSVAGFVAALGPEMKVEGDVVVQQLAQAPELVASPRPAFKDKPRRDGDRDRDRARKPRDSKPVDWNDDPAPRKKKPKPAGKPTYAKGQHKAAHVAKSDAPAPKAKYKADGDGATKPWKKPEAADGDAGKKPRRQGTGPKPPVGKPSSKKNRARALAAGKKPGKSGPGGEARPKRRKNG